MDDAARGKIRRAARRLHILAQALLALNLGFLAVYGFIVGQTAPDVYAQREFGRASGALTAAFNSFDHARTIALTAFVPPIDPARQRAWAEQIAQHMGQDVAVFLRAEGRTVWVNPPAAFAPAVEKVTRVLEPGTDERLPARTDTLGSTLLVHSVFTLDSTLYHVQMVSVPESQLRWGIVYRLFDGWRAFLKGLEGARLAVELEPAAVNAKHVVQLTAPQNEQLSSLTGLQAFLRGEELYRSPGLDTTAESWTSDFGELQLVYYLSGEDRAFQSFIRPRTLPFRALMTLGVMLVLFLNWQWIRKLTS